ncbi:hypothetical protein SALBM311S_11553 [Streptomyces alboniger]
MAASVPSRLPLPDDTASTYSATVAETEPMRLPDMPLHDPFIVADKKTRTYYLYTSNYPSVSGVDGTGTMVYRTTTLRDWMRPVVVFLAAEQEGIWATDGGWAPEVHQWGGRYYLFTTLHNQDKVLPVPPPGQWGTPFQLPNHMRGTITAVSDSLLGPFAVVDPSRPTPPENLMTLDGTLYVDPSGQPWMVYAHEWLQTIDGTMEAIRLASDLSRTIGDPVFLFKASDAFWINEQIPGGVPHQLPPYVTDGPQVHHAPDGSLLILWLDLRKAHGRPGRHHRRRLRTDLRGLDVRRHHRAVAAAPAAAQGGQRSRHAVPHLRRPADDGRPPPLRQRSGQAVRHPTCRRRRSG